MKKKRLSLDQLKVKSFVTSYDNDTAQTLKGGASVNGPLCSNVLCESDACPESRTCPEGPSTEVATQPANCVTGNHPCNI